MLFLFSCKTEPESKTLTESQKWEEQAGNITIIRDDFGVPHIYGKTETRPFRKMGHVTIVDQDINKAREIAETVKKTIKVISEDE